MGTATGPSDPSWERRRLHLSDLAFVTSDNPRDEDPLAIIEEVLAGIPGGRADPRVTVEPDRGVAIRRALDAAGPGDVVVIAGKGHETWQEVAGQRLPFDDAVEARRALSLRFGSDPRTWADPPGARPVGAVVSAHIGVGSTWRQSGGLTARARPACLGIRRSVDRHPLHPLPDPLLPPT